MYKSFIEAIALWEPLTDESLIHFRDFRNRSSCFYFDETSETGAVRDGDNVTKTTHELNNDFKWINRYQKARARGEPRSKVRRDLGIEHTSSTLIDMEWNAVIYCAQILLLFVERLETATVERWCED